MLHVVHSVLHGTNVDWSVYSQSNVARSLLKYTSLHILLKVSREVILPQRFVWSEERSRLPLSMVPLKARTHHRYYLTPVLGLTTTMVCNVCT